MASASDTLKAGLRHHQAGRLPQAESLYRQVLRVDPAQPYGLHLLGLACQQQGRHEAAIEYFDRAAPLRAGDADVYCDRAVTYFALGRIDEAMADCRRALEIDPDRVNAQNNLAHALNEKGEFEEAERWCREAIRRDPELADAQVNLGRALRGQEKFKEAEVAYQRALDIEPNHTRALGNLSWLYLKQQRFRDTEAVCRKALAVEPDNVEMHVQLGKSLDRQGWPDKALACFKHALELDSENAETLTSLAEFYETDNDLKKAEGYALRGLKIAPDHRELNLVLSACEIRGGRLRQAADRLERVLAEPDGHAMADLHFQQGRVYDRLGRHEEAFAAWQKANALASREIEVLGFDKTVSFQRMAQARRRFDPAWIRSWTTAPPVENERSPVFMIGFPRSGTTLLDQILDSHPRIQTLEEKPTLEEIQKTLPLLGERGLRTVAGLLPEHFTQLREAYFQAVGLYLDRRPELLLIDRNPFMSGSMGMAHRVFPSAKIILAARHPCDVCLSCFAQVFRFNIGTAHLFNLDDVAKFYAEMMGLWKHYLSVLPLDYHVVRYEDLVDDFEGQTRRLLDFLEVEWDDNVRNHAQHARGRTIRTASYHQVVEPLYRRSRYRWRRYAKQLAGVMDTLQPYIEYFGYDSQE